MDNIIDFYIDKGRKEGLIEGQQQGWQDGLAKGQEEARLHYEPILADKDRALEDKDRTLAEMEQELRELKQRFGIA